MGGQAVRHTRLAHGKLNLFLEVMGRRADGFHDIVSVFQEIDLADRLTARVLDSGQLTLTCDTPGIPTDEHNLVLQAVGLLQAEMGIRAGLHIHLEKKIPAGGGLGGGSSDAAAALFLAADAWGLDLDHDALLPLAARVGSDVPFFLWGGTCLCEGRGERVTSLRELPPTALDFALILPPWGVATAAAYAGLKSETFASVSADRFLAALSAGDGAGIARESFNRFEETVCAKIPAQQHLRDALHASGVAPHARLSGTGAAMWCMTQGEATVLETLRDTLDQEMGCQIRSISNRLDDHSTEDVHQQGGSSDGNHGSAHSSIDRRRGR